MKLAFLYAGQGSQKEGMGKDFYEAFPQIRHIFDSKKAGFDIRRMCFLADIKNLSQTKYTQPTMAAFGAAVTALLYEKGLKPSFSAGLSLGEYCALHSAGAFDFETLLDLVAYRGEVMESTTAHMDTKMAAVLGLDAHVVSQAVLNASTMNKGVVSCSNFNCSGQTVIGGHADAVDAAIRLLIEAGARRCVPLQVNAPFHTPLMKEAADLMKEKLDSVHFEKLNFPVVFNDTADILKENETIQGHLHNQITSPVLFEKSLIYLEESGVDTVIEIGPGNAISGFVKKTSPKIKTYSIENIGSFEKTLSALEV